MDGELRKNGKLYVGNGNQLRKKIISNIHGSSKGGHSGITTTTKRIEELFFWPTLKKEVMEYVKAYDTCQRCKPKHVSTPGLLQPLPFRTRLGKQSLWILLRAFQDQMEKRLYW